jgi:hypothetical protein
MNSPAVRVVRSTPRGCACAGVRPACQLPGRGGAGRGGFAAVGPSSGANPCHPHCPQRGPSGRQQRWARKACAALLWGVSYVCAGLSSGALDRCRGVYFPLREHVCAWPVRVQMGWGGWRPRARAPCPRSAASWGHCPRACPRMRGRWVGGRVGFPQIAVSPPPLSPPPPRPPQLRFLRNRGAASECP